jgi:hypothetical protein
MCSFCTSNKKRNTSFKVTEFAKAGKLFGLMSTDSYIEVSQPPSAKDIRRQKIACCSYYAASSFNVIGCINSDDLELKLEDVVCDMTEIRGLLNKYSIIGFEIYKGELLAGLIGHLSVGVDDVRVVNVNRLLPYTEEIYHSN